MPESTSKKSNARLLRERHSRCNHCGYIGKEGALQKCGRCKDAYYCSKECQVEHWKLHKKECPEMKHTGIQSTSIFTGKDLEFNFDKRASNLVQYSANSLILLSAAWANSDEKLPVSLVIDIDNSAIAKGFTPPYRYTVQKLKLAPVDTSPAISTLFKY